MTRVQAPLAVVTVPLASTGATNVSGRATIESLSDQPIRSQVALSGLAANQQFVAHIHNGTCADQGSIVVWPMNLASDGGGTAQNPTTETVALGSIATGQTYLRMHAGPLADSPVVLRGNLPAVNAAPPQGAPSVGAPDFALWAGRSLVLLGLLGTAGGLKSRRRA